MHTGGLANKHFIPRLQNKPQRGISESTDAGTYMDLRQAVGMPEPLISDALIYTVLNSGILRGWHQFR